MSIAEVLGMVLGLVSIGAAIVTVLIRTLFLGLKSRHDGLERRVEEYHTKCMDEIIRLTKEGQHGS